MRPGSNHIVAAQDSAKVYPAFFIEGQFSGGNVRLWTGHGEFIWGSRVFLGGGLLLGISGVEETIEVASTSVTVSLSGVPSEFVALALGEAEQNAPGTIWLGHLNANAEMVAEPIVIFRGRLDVPQIEDDSETCTISFTYESDLVDLIRERSWRYTHESQQVLHPGDRGLEYVSAIQQREVPWGKA